MRADECRLIEMAFMMPVVKNEWDIYKTNRNRRSSECSNPQACRSRKVSAKRYPGKNVRWSIRPDGARSVSLDIRYGRT